MLKIAVTSHFEFEEKNFYVCYKKDVIDKIDAEIDKYLFVKLTKYLMHNRLPPKFLNQCFKIDIKYYIFIGNQNIRGKHNAYNNSVRLSK